MMISSVNVLTCAKCYTQFIGNFRISNYFLCGHSFCDVCLREISLYNSINVCPICIYRMSIYQSSGRGSNPGGDYLTKTHHRHRSKVYQKSSQPLEQEKKEEKEMAVLYRIKPENNLKKINKLKNQLEELTLEERERDNSDKLKMNKMNEGDHSLEKKSEDEKSETNKLLSSDQRDIKRKLPTKNKHFISYLMEQEKIYTYFTISNRENICQTIYIESFPDPLFKQFIYICSGEFGITYKNQPLHCCQEDRENGLIFVVNCFMRDEEIYENKIDFGYMGEKNSSVSFKSDEILVFGNWNGAFELRNANYSLLDNPICLGKVKGSCNVELFPTNDVNVPIGKITNCGIASD